MKALQFTLIAQQKQRALATMKWKNDQFSIQAVAAT